MSEAFVSSCIMSLGQSVILNGEPFTASSGDYPNTVKVWYMLTGEPHDVIVTGGYNSVPPGSTFVSSHESTDDFGNKNIFFVWRISRG